MTTTYPFPVFLGIREDKNASEVVRENNPVSDQVITTVEVHGEGNLSWAFGQWRNNVEHGNWGAVDKRSGDTWSIRMLTFNVTPSTAEA